MNAQTLRRVRYAPAAATGFGTLLDTDAGERIAEYRGDMFGARQASGRLLALDSVRLLHPTQPSKVIALWNNFAALSTKLGLGAPAELLYLLKPASQRIRMRARVT
jgi:hypothetical protein